jgi:hypothetical protein
MLESSNLEGLEVIHIMGIIPNLQAATFISR